MRTSAEIARGRFVAARVAQLATVSAAGQPHLVPVTFAVVTAAVVAPDLSARSAADLIVFAVDHKPKSSTALRRLANIAANPLVSFLVDRYVDDWAGLWWARADATAAVLDGAVRSDAIVALQSKYPQYRDVPPNGIVVGGAVRRWSGWQAARTTHP